MMTFLLVVHSLIAVALVAVILLQRSEGGALGIGGGGGGGLVSARGAANLLTRSTAILAGLFILTSIGLAFLARIEKGSPSEIDRLLQESAPVTGPAGPGEAAPAAPAVPGEAAPAAPADTLPALPSVPVGD